MFFSSTLKFTVILLCYLSPFFVFGQHGNGNQRLIILADMGNEPDEEQQMMHMLMCSHAFDLEGLIAVTGKFLRPESKDPYKQIVHPELFYHLIEGYEKVVENLKLHANGWPDPDYLRSIVVSGQPGYGIESTGPGKSSEGSELILKTMEKDDDRPVYVVVNAGSNTLAQAIKDYQRTHSQREMNAFIAKLRVFENGAQDNAGAWICHKFPDIHWIRSNYQTYCYGGPAFEGNDDKRDLMNLGPYTWEPYAYSGLGQHQWALEHIIGDHGSFGKYFPLRQFGHGGIHFLEGGGTIPWLALVNKGLTDIDHPEWGGWSGRYSKEKVANVWSKHNSVNIDEKAFQPFSVHMEESDAWINPEDGKKYDSLYAPVWRWRRAFFNDFQCRMDWCIKSFPEANHHPLASINGDDTDQIISLNTQPDETITLDASGSSDPDRDVLDFRWFIYKEAGTYPEGIELSDADKPVVKLKIPQDASGKTFHIILEIQDQNEVASLFDYRRVVVSVE